MTEPADPLRTFFDNLGHRLDQFRTLAPVGYAGPTLDTHDLYNVWLRDNQNRREVRILKEEQRTLREENSRLRRALIDSSGPEPKETPS